MGEQNRRAVDDAPPRVTPKPSPPPGHAPEPGSADVRAVDARRDERQTRRMAPDTASPGEAADE